jgi:hypothetical protein
LENRSAPLNFSLELNHEAGKRGGIWLRAEFLRGLISLPANEQVEIPILRAAEESTAELTSALPTDGTCAQLGGNPAEASVPTL